jgi:hypothetical protein
MSIFKSHSALYTPIDFHLEASLITIYSFSNTFPHSAFFTPFIHGAYPYRRFLCKIRYIGGFFASATAILC